MWMSLNISRSRPKLDRFRGADFQSLGINRRFGGPASHIALDQVGKGIDPVVILVERWNVVELLATSAEKVIAGLLGNFFQRFEAIGDKTGADHVNATDALGAHVVQGGGGVGL